MWHILVRFRQPYCMYTWFHHEIHGCHYGSNWRNIEKIELSLGELLPVYLVDNCICNTGCLVGFRGLQNITYYIWNGEMQNLADWPAEFWKNCRGLGFPEISKVSWNCREI